MYIRVQTAKNHHCVKQGARFGDNDFPQILGRLPNPYPPGLRM